jgi:hypothetical protein
MKQSKTTNPVKNDKSLTILVIGILGLLAIVLKTYYLMPHVHP